MDDKSVEKIIKTISAIANGGEKIAGKIILGVADKDTDANRIQKLDRIVPKIVGRKKIVGIVREARFLGKSLEDYFHLIRDKIRNSPLSEPLKSECLSKIDFNSFYGLGVIVLTVPPQNDVSYYGEDVYFRDGDHDCLREWSASSRRYSKTIFGSLTIPRFFTITIVGSARLFRFTAISRLSPLPPELPVRSVMQEQTGCSRLHL